MRKYISYNTVNFQPVTFRILFFRGIQTLQMRLSRKACFWWTQLLRPFCRAANETCSVIHFPDYKNTRELYIYIYIYIYLLMQNSIGLYEILMPCFYSSLRNAPIFRKQPTHKNFRSPPEHFAIGYVHNDNLPLGNIALHVQYAIQNNCRKVWRCFLMISCTF